MRSARDGDAHHVYTRLIVFCSVYSGLNAIPMLNFSVSVQLFHAFSFASCVGSVSVCLIFVSEV